MKNLIFSNINEAVSAAGTLNPVLIAGCTASGKSSLALEIAKQHGGVIVNADAMQVYDNWDVLTARPPVEDLNQAKHLMYGHVPHDQAYTVGDWLRDIRKITATKQRLIIVGGTGLFFRSLTEGLAEIPEITSEIIQKAREFDIETLLSELDSRTLSVIDVQNPARVQRAWAVQKQTGKSIIQWHAETPSPLVPLSDSVPIHLDANPDWLQDRIERRFDLMIKTGALDEARANLDGWNPNLLSSKAIGGPELIAHIKGETDLDTARNLSIIATRQYAKRQRTWFRKRMKGWNKIILG